jgi:replicative DNA helicase
VDDAEIIFGKHRNGKIGSIFLKYVSAYTQFEERIAPVNNPYSDAG